LPRARRHIFVNHFGLKSWNVLSRGRWSRPMCKKELQLLLTETMRDVLETSFFADILEERSVDVQLDGSSVIAASVRFSGAATGSFVVVAETVVARMLAAEFLGESGEEDDEAALSVPDEEVFKELANILCGSVLSRFSTDRCCSLSQPVICSNEIAGQWKELFSFPYVHSAVRLESGLLAGCWKLDVAR